MPDYLKKAKQKPEQDLRGITEVVAQILDRVRSEGEEAVRFYSRKFDGWDPPSFRVTQGEIEQACESLSDLERQDIDFCQEQIRNFAQRQRDAITGFEVETLPGVHLGQKTIPIAASGSYVPGGRYPLLASAHMTIITPKVAGVDRVVACAPPTRGEGIDPGTLYSMVAAGADDIYGVGGVQALAAMAYGMDGLEPVDMIVGAGNIYVSEAKRQLYGEVGIDLLAGPTEILVLVDETADPNIVAADILGEECPMHKYAVQVTVADARDGALSGSTLKEASSWGKVETTHEQMVYSEATLAMPLIAGYGYHKGAWKNRKAKYYSDFLNKELAKVGGN